MQHAPTICLALTFIDRQSRLHCALLFNPGGRLAFISSKSIGLKVNANLVTRVVGLEYLLSIGSGIIDKAKQK